MTADDRRLGGARRTWARHLHARRGRRSARSSSRAPARRPGRRSGQRRVAAWCQKVGFEREGARARPPAPGRAHPRLLMFCCDPVSFGSDSGARRSSRRRAAQVTYAVVERRHGLQHARTPLTRTDRSETRVRRGRRRKVHQLRRAIEAHERIRETWAAPSPWPRAHRVQLAPRRDRRWTNGSAIGAKT